MYPCRSVPFPLIQSVSTAGNPAIETDGNRINGVLPFMSRPSAARRGQTTPCTRGSCRELNLGRIGPHGENRIKGLLPGNLSSRNAIAQHRIYGERGIDWAWFHSSQSDRDSVDRWLVKTGHPFAFEAGTPESRFRRIVKALLVGDE